ncbi:ribosome assembly factor SBDS [Candidatus Woesearchaeota archaeon CG10_big_fil_rev_8_21_14_0_10_34_8]|nr:MAG: ribosome assembly factor SBDS [Candidatus Woesearchaeota archaeon CG10_big_fil_rev_8_21_14_0_10_34_8]
MVDVDKAVIARLKTHGDIFEILVDCENALLVKQKRKENFDDVLASEKIFSDAKKGIFASEKKMQEVFGTSAPLEVAKIILQKGDLQVTAAHRSKETEEKRRKILHYIHRNGVDPRTKLPHPLKRIELAFDEAKIKIDDHKDSMEQVQEILKKLQLILPIRFERKQVEIRIPAQHAGRCFGAVKGMAKIIKENWENDGSWKGVVEIPGGMQNELFDKLNSMTQGSVAIEILKIEEA